MSNITLIPKQARQVGVAMVLVSLATLLGIWALPTQAIQSSGQFAVTINLNSNGSLAGSGLCRSSTRVGIFGAAVVVICSTGAATNFTGDTSVLPWTMMQDSSYRFVTQVSKAGISLGTIDSYSGGGTITTWRVINLANRDYLEMMVHW